MRLRQESLKNVTLLIKRGIAPKYVKDEGVCIINQKCVRDGRVDFSPSRLTHTNTKIAPEKYLQEGDILVNSTGTGTLGRTAFFLDQKGSRGATVDTHVTIVRADQKKVAPRYLAYLMRLKEPSIVNMARGATNQIELSAVNLGELQVWLHDLLAQYRIASVLSAYDDLIENNRRRIQLLEQAARLLYKEWFVHLRFPGHEHTPIIDGVPEGWEKTTIGESAAFISRGITPKYDDDAPCIVINQKCIRDRMVNLDFARRQSKQVPPGKLVQFGDVLINSTGAGTLGRVAQLLFEIDECTVDSHVTIVRPKEGVPAYYFGLHLTGLESYVATLGRGATNQTELSKDDIAALEIDLPSSRPAQIFESIVAPSFRQIRVLSEQIEKLIKARDLLLPKLMNGEVVV
jgi:type I restriction enzyme, S subunit